MGRHKKMLGKRITNTNSAPLHYVLVHPSVHIFNFRSDPRQLATHLQDLIDDKAKYVEYFWWKDFYTGNIYNLLYV